MATVTLTIDGKEVTVEQGTTILRAAKQIGYSVPHYCYHPGLSIAGNCRICLVEIEKAPKLMPGCSTTVMKGMVVHTNSPRVQEGRRGVLELMMTNHPLDCPICDQAGECKLQDYYMKIGLYQSRVKFPKEHKPKVVKFPPHITFDAERCILCSRCVRFCQEITKTNELVFIQRGQHAEITTFKDGGRIDNGYAGNLHEICPVGALTSTDFRFKQRVWWLKSHDSVCPGCSTGCNIRIQENKGVVYRYLARENQDVNKWWLCDAGRYDYKYINAADRLLAPRLAGGKAAAWDEALKIVAERLGDVAAKKGKIAGIASAKLTNEELFLFRRYLAGALGSDMIDFRIDDSAAKLDVREDELLKRADKNPNTKGAMELGLTGSADASQILQKAAEGGVDALYVLDAWRLEEAGLLDALKAARGKVGFIVMHSIKACAALELADVVLPTATFAEKDGTFTNFEGRVQKIKAAIKPLKGCKTDLEIFASLLASAKSGAPISGAAAVFAMMAAEAKAFEGLAWGTLPAGGALIGRKAERMAE